MSKTLFVVDDSATMRKVFELTFAGEGIQIVTHPNADNAAQRARDAKPNVAIVDVNLGDGVSGYDVVRAIRANSGLGPIPIYLLYSEHTPLDETAARSCGASGALAKPFDSQAIIERVASAMNSPAQAAPAPSPVTATAPLAPQRTAAPPLPRSAMTLPSGPAMPLPAAPRPASPAPAVPSPSPVGVRPAISTVRANPVAPIRASQTHTPQVEDSPLEAPTPVAIAPSPSQPASLRPTPMESPVTAAAAEVGALAHTLGLSPEQVSAITALTRDVVERVVWEVVPSLAETMIREELKRLTAD